MIRPTTAVFPRVTFLLFLFSITTANYLSPNDTSSKSIRLSSFANNSKFEISNKESNQNRIRIEPLVVHNANGPDYYGKRRRTKKLLVNATTVLTKLKIILTPKLSARSVSVCLDWSNYAKNFKSTVGPIVGTTLTLYDGTEPVAHLTNTAADCQNYYTITGLEQDRIYRGNVKFSTRPEELKNFFRDELTTVDSNEPVVGKFELTTPFIVSDANVRNILETKEILEQKFLNDMPSVTVRHVDINLIFPKIDKFGYIVDVSRYRLKPNGTDIGETEQTIQLIPPVKGVTLTGQRPHELLKISLKTVKNISNSDNSKDNDKLCYETIHSVNVFTGSAYKLGSTNLSRLLDDAENAAENGVHRSNSSIITSIQNGTAAPLMDQFNGESGRRSVRCYTDDDVFSGYPCRNSDICIPQDWVCDGEADCRGRDDERGCDDDDFNGYSEYRGNCRKYEFRCRSRGQSVCLPNSWLCDGRVDCTDGWDEDEGNCFRSYNTARPGFISERDHPLVECSNQNRFRCWDSNECVGPRLVCDGREDCLDGSDEKICDNWSKNCDLGFEFRCYKSISSADTFFNRKCIPRSWICDDQQDCPDGEDESYRICRNFNHRISLANILSPFGIDFMINAGLNRM